MPGKLVGREAEVEQDGIHRLDPQAFQDVSSLAIGGVDQSHRQAERRLFGQFEHGGVAVEADEPSRFAQLLGQCRRVSARAHGAVHHGHARFGGDGLDHLVQQDGAVDSIRRLQVGTHGGSARIGGERGVQELAIGRRGQNPEGTLSGRGFLSTPAVKARTCPRHYRRETARLKRDSGEGDGYMQILGLARSKWILNCEAEHCFSGKFQQL